MPVKAMLEEADSGVKLGEDTIKQVQEKVYDHIHASKPLPIRLDDILGKTAKEYELEWDAGKNLKGDQGSYLGIDFQSRRRHQAYLTSKGKAACEMVCYRANGADREDGSRMGQVDMWRVEGERTADDSGDNRYPGSANMDETEAD
ncbi:hypothetical protein EV426DRAFT_706767 [Tirmania nivea]|nr:hypothetical protein EV426DRAFT_706767 [Tirmania nivea]